MEVCKGQEVNGNRIVIGERFLGPRRKTVGVISYLLLKGWTVGPRPGPWTYCPTNGFLLTKG
ncbi:hypothetical protein J6590_011148 [Homalodisca vitripennis]|nr:hypothetical protein J6590_011148 [Homalodisca vitripennis]